MPTKELHPENDAESISEKKRMHLISNPGLGNFKNEYFSYLYTTKEIDRSIHGQSTWSITKTKKMLTSFFGLSHINLKKWKIMKLSEKTT